MFTFRFSSVYFFVIACFLIDSLLFTDTHTLMIPRKWLVLCGWEVCERKAALSETQRQQHTEDR